MKTSTKLKIAGCFFLVVGVTLIILGTVVFSEDKGGGMVFPNFGFMTPGIFIAFISLPCFFIGFMPNIAAGSAKLQNEAYEKGAKDMQEAAKRGAEIGGTAVEITARAAKKGFTGEAAFCPHCGQSIDSGSSFCKYCGGKQE